MTTRFAQCYWVYSRSRTFGVFGGMVELLESWARLASLNIYDVLRMADKQLLTLIYSLIS